MWHPHPLGLQNLRIVSETVASELSECDEGVLETHSYSLDLDYNLVSPGEHIKAVVLPNLDPLFSRLTQEIHSGV